VDDDGEELRWRIVEEPTLTRGGCRVESEDSRIDATVEARLGALIARALGGEREEDAAPAGTETAAAGSGTVPESTPEPPSEAPTETAAEAPPEPVSQAEPETDGATAPGGANAPPPPTNDDGP